MKNIINERPSDTLFGRNLALLKFIKNKDIKEKIVLDLGCGFGWLEYNFANLAKKIIAMDLDKKNLAMCKKYVKEKNVVFMFGNALEIPIKTNSLETVIASELIEHLPKKSENNFFIEINRVLKKNGVFYLTTPFKSFWSKTFDPAWWLINHRHYSHNELKKWAQKNGFVETDYKVVGSWWSLLSLLNMYISKWIFRREKFFKNFFNKKETEEFFKDSGFMNIFISFKKI
ncbi:MAG: class I SAM-dependent methyltransferase [Candidatus Shapirobacteria bacterium]|jgi:ubiquinone/menaquinone biosynthesis C-methylase UbiE